MFSSLARIRPQGTAFCILTQLQFRGKAVGSLAGIGWGIGRRAPEVEARCVRLSTIEIV